MFLSQIGTANITAPAQRQMLDFADVWGKKNKKQRLLICLLELRSFALWDLLEFISQTLR